MKERLKVIGNKTLKCFATQKAGSESISYSFNTDAIKDINDSELLSKDDLCMPSTSQEKGTMTDSSLQKKNKTANISGGASSKGLQNVSENKADEKVPLVILSKSSNSGRNDDDGSNEQEKNKVNVESSSDYLLNRKSFNNRPNFKKNIKQITSPSKNRTFLDDCTNMKNSFGYKSDLNYSNESPSNSSPDFKGFSGSEGESDILSSVKISQCGNKKINRKLFTNLDEELIAKENELASLDHPYSHATEKIKPNSISNDLPISDNEYPHFVSRSVFGSPTNRTPPDIMLHNDKINILRQMSKVFNDEKSSTTVQSESHSAPSGSSPQLTKVNDAPVIGKNIDATSTKPAKVVDIDKMNKEDKNLPNNEEKKVPKNAEKKLPTMIEKKLSAISEKKLPTITERKLPTVAEKKLPTIAEKKLSAIAEKKLPTMIEKKLPTITERKLSAITEKKLSITAEKKVPNTLEKKIFNTVEKKVLNTVEKKVPIIIDKKVPNAEEKMAPNNDDKKVPNSKENKPPDEEGKPSSNNEEKQTASSGSSCNKITNEENPSEISNVHLVSSYSLNKDESIKVESYTGSQGEDIDVIDGFTFFSFEAEADMLNYAPPQSVKKIKKHKLKGKKAKHVNENKPGTEDFVAENSTEDASDNLNSSSNDSTMNQQFEKFPSQNEESETAKDAEKSKTANASAFSSNDLEEYLNEHAELRISFPIPKCRETENGVTKFDDAGNPIWKQESSPSKPSSENKGRSLCEKKEEKLANQSTSKRGPIASKQVMKLPPKLDVMKQQPNLKSGKVFVKRGGSLLPISSVFKKPICQHSNEEDNVFEMIYVYHSGRLLTLAGSLTKMNPTNQQSIKAKVALPRGHKRLIKHAQRVASRTVKAVEINKDLAEFALSALRTPNKVENKSDSVKETKTNPVIEKINPDKVTIKETVKPSKDNILDILAAKFSIPKEKPSVTSDPLDITRTNSPPPPTKLDNKKNFNENESSTAANEPVTQSKVRWNHNDILKSKKDAGYSMDRSKVFKKNINRFPSLSREMKRLNMNFVSYNKKDSDVEDDLEDEVTECNNDFCSMGCICDSLKCRRKSPVHCGKVECMFQCTCTVESWREGKTTEVPISIFPLFSADYENKDNLALKEKDFKKTVVQSGSDIFMIGGEKKKRDIRVPQRFRDSHFWGSSLTSNTIPPEILNGNYANKENVPILPGSYKQHIKDFHLNVPWYDVSGASVWCMFHSCYDCYCLSDQSSFYESENEVSSQNEDDPALTSDKQKDFDTKPCKIICFKIKFKNPYTTKSPEKGEWKLKHWIHNAYLHSARTCGYVPKDIIIKETDDVKKEYNPPLPKPPFVLGITLKISDDEFQRMPKSTPYSSSGNRKAIFYDGLGPSKTTNLCSIQNPDAGLKSASKNEILLNTFPNINNDLIVTDPPKALINSVEDPLMQNNDFKTLTSDEDMEVTNIKSGVSSKVLGNDEDLKSFTGKGDGQFSLFEMIKEEEKRGELEIDLSSKEEGNSMLITESRFRKLINMSIVGITGLNKAGRCIIDAVNSAEDLVKMQRIHNLIISNAIDVGPNMKEIFSSTHIDQKMRFVLIRCSLDGKWEIIGVVQKKNVDKENNVIPKSKRQKSKSALPSVIMNNLKFKPHSSSSMNMDDSNSLDSSDCMPGNSNEYSNTNNRTNLVLEEGDPEPNLPCISSVVSADNPEFHRLIGSPPKLSENYDETFKEKSVPSTSNFILNQPSGKVFGLRKLVSGQLGTSMIASPYSKLNESSDSQGLLGLNTSTPKCDFKGRNFFICPKGLTPNTPQENLESLQNKKQNIPSPAVVSTGGNLPGEKFRMLIVPSTTAPGKSFLIPTVGEVPPNYTLVLRKPNESPIIASPGTNQLSCGSTYSKGSNSTENIGLPLNFTTATSKNIPLVQSTSSKFPLVPIVSSKTGLTVTSNQAPSVGPNNYISLLNKPEILPKNNINFYPSIKIPSNPTVIATSSNLIAKSSATENNLVTSSSNTSMASTYSTSIRVSPSVFQSTTPPASVPVVGSVSSSMKEKTVSSTKCKKEVGDPKTVAYNNNSPDVKCISVKKQENCTAVDLSIQFKSVKLHWLCGTIKKNVLVNAFKMSKKVNAPVSLNARKDNVMSSKNDDPTFKNNATEKASFLGMHQFCVNDYGQIFPVLLLGTKLQSVLATSKQGAKELFRSNTLKYIVKDTSGELSSYTYDARGANLIKIASKKNEQGVQIHGLGEKIPVDSLRGHLPDIDYPNEVGNHSREWNTEEIIISDSDDEVAGQKVKRTKLKPHNQKLNYIRSSKPVLVSPLKDGPSKIKDKSPSNSKEILNSMCDNKDTSSLRDQSKVLLVTENIPSKDIEASFSDNVPKEHSSLRIKLDEKSLPQNRKLLSNNAKMLSKSSEAPNSSVKHVLRVPTRFLNRSVSENKEEMKILSEQSPSSHLGPFTHNPSNRIGIDVVTNENEPSFPPKRKSEISSTSKSIFETAVKMTGSESKFQGKNAMLKGSSMRVPMAKKDDSLKPENNLEISFNSSTTLSVCGDDISLTCSSSEDEQIDIEKETGLSFLRVLKKKQKDECVLDERPPAVKRKLSSGNDDKPCPLSKKPVQKRNETSRKNIGEISKNLTKGKVKGNFITNSSKSKLSTIGSTSNTLDGRVLGAGNHSSAQEFQQVFSGAPQFWLMDNTEKHNTLERIRRKGLAKMLENLYCKARDSTEVSRFPPKHIILKLAEEVIMEMRRKDIKLAKAEIELRERKTQLLNTLSELLKDCEEDTQKIFESWISTNINNPTAKTKFEDSWIPGDVVFEDEHILTNSCGELTVSGSDITSYFASHTAGFTPTKNSHKAKGFKTQLKKKFPFKISSSSTLKLSLSSHSLKSKLPLGKGAPIMAPRKPPLLFHNVHSSQQTSSQASKPELANDEAPDPEEKEETHCKTGDDLWLRLLSSPTKKLPLESQSVKESKLSSDPNDTLPSATSVSDSLQGDASELDSKLRLSPFEFPSPSKKE